MTRHDATYRLYYWPFIQGRGEFLRLIMEDAEADYVDVGRLPESQGGGVEAVAAVLENHGKGPPAFAPPVLEAGELVLAQTPTIGRFLAERCDRAPVGTHDSWHADQIALTIADFVVEIHDTHHPVGAMTYYEDQKAESLRRAQSFREHRLPKFIDYFERVLEENTASGGAYLVGDSLSYVDLWMFQALEGLHYAFPTAYAQTRDAMPRLCALRDRVAERPQIATYLASERRIPFNEMGLFRHYPELDAAP